jgi:distribution and morphology protein 34
MAFNFNWSPLIADTDRVRDMLTSALNKSPKPPIIVDDIIVNELNLGSTPPELEILEIGDLAEDKFRGIFKMSYAGDAYLTLKTRVQANPLHTFLSTRPSFTNPQPLAANSSLTIPIQITLSEFRLSGFVILVFSKQKGITIVFRNDPLETLKVSSTFDSIPFVRNFLQKTIENQLRVLFMEDLPAIIHHLSLRLFSPEHQLPSESAMKKLEADYQKPVDTFSSNDILESEAIAQENATDLYASFSQKSMLRLAALSESQRTLSLSTPNIRDTVYRAWTHVLRREEMGHYAQTPTIRPVSLSKLQSSIATPSLLSSAASQTSDGTSPITRPSLINVPSSASVYSFGSGAPRSRPGKKRKHRVVNLRKSKAADGDNVDDSASMASSYDESASRSVTGSADSSGKHPSTIPTTVGSAIREGEIHTPPQSPQHVSRTRRGAAEGVVKPRIPSSGLSRPTTPPPQSRSPSSTSLQIPHSQPDLDPTPRASVLLSSSTLNDETTNHDTIKPLRRIPPHQQPWRQHHHSTPSRSPSPELLRRSSSTESHHTTTSQTERRLQSLLTSVLATAAADPDSEHHLSASTSPRTNNIINNNNIYTGGGGILEQAWMQKMTNEIARKVAAEEKSRAASFGGRGASFEVFADASSSTTTTTTKAVRPPIWRASLSSSSLSLGAHQASWAASSAVSPPPAGEGKDRE